MDASFREERAELETLLSSGLFARSPALAQMLRYICAKHFDGQSDQIKEYSIAVEALGRPENFDQKRDSIVRVEAHRLRKRLEEYYRTDGAGRTIQITVPCGNYVPHFVRLAEPLIPPLDEAQAPENETQVRPVALIPSVDTPAAPARPPESRQHTFKSWGGIALLALMAGMGLYLWRSFGTEKSAPPVRSSVLAAVPEPAGSSDDEVRILAGSDTARLVDHYGNTWLGDRFFHGGQIAHASPRPIGNSEEPALYFHRREGDFSYDVPLKNGFYELRLHFAETVFGDNNIAGGGETSRLFNVRANGKDLLRYFDVIADAVGSNIADIKVFKDIQPAADGLLHLTFVSTNKDTPFINGIEILPSRRGAIRPVRIVSRNGNYTDRNNRVWSSDRYVHGGTLVKRQDPIVSEDDPGIYQSERYGNFSYTIPVAESGRYSATLKFCENWFGPGRMGVGGVGSRIFDVYLNGKTLLNRFDIFKEAGSLRALDKTFTGLTPNPQGKLTFTFTPVVNYALIDAVEIADEAWK